MRHQRYVYGFAAGAAAAVVLGACSNTTTDTQASPSATSAVTSNPPSAATSASHNDADVSFAQNMIPHHQQAIEMSDMLLDKQDIDPKVSSLATQIKDAQGPEIEQMQAWLKEWGAASTAEPGSMPGHDMSDGDMSEMPHMSGMPSMSGMPGMSGMGGGHGMMSAADMEALEKAQGVEASRLFLTQMIEHHKGAITMAQQEIDKGQFPEAVEMARNIVSSQQKEITAMQEMLKG